MLWPHTGLEAPPVEQNLFAHLEAPEPDVMEEDQGRCDPPERED